MSHLSRITNCDLLDATIANLCYRPKMLAAGMLQGLLDAYKPKGLYLRLSRWR
jgi:hypothetical protein